MQMSDSQLYIGSENGVVLCVDRISHHNVSGRFYHRYKDSASVFLNFEDLLFQMEDLFNKLVFPYPSTSERQFIKAQDTGSQVTNDRRQTEKREKIMKDEELLMQHGDLGSFIVRVQHRQNSSWQGRITWIEKNQTVYFRSVWEMMKLIENAIDCVSPEENEPEPVWSDT